MRYNNRQAINTPLATKVVELRRKLLWVGRRMKNGRKKRNQKISEEREVTMPCDLRHIDFDKIQAMAFSLFVSSLHQLRPYMANKVPDVNRPGNSYIKESLKYVEDIQAGCWLVQALGGMSDITCAEIDKMCDEIAEQLFAMLNRTNDRNHQAIGEDERV